MAWTGVRVLARFAPAARHRWEELCFGAIVGLILGRLSTIVVWAVLGPSPIAAAIATIATAAVGLIVKPPRPERTLHDFSPYEPLAFLGATLTITALPYASAGVLTDQGYAFARYFNKDFMNHAAVAAELARSLPPENPYVAGQPLHYYWLFHVWPASLKSITGDTAWNVVAVTSAIDIAIFVTAVSLTLARSGAPAWARKVTLAVGLFAYSYLGIGYLIQQVLPLLPDYLPNAEGLSFTFISHSWFRDFLYEPHAIWALLAFLLLWHCRRCSPDTLGSAVLQGLSLGAVLLSDAFLGLLVGSWVALAAVVRFAQGVRVLKASAALGGVALLLALVGFLLEMFPVGGRPLVLAAHPTLKIAPLFLLGDLGPVFILGVFGLASAIRTRMLSRTDPLVLFLAVVAIGAFVVRMPMEADIALRKGLKLLQLGLVLCIPHALGVARTAAWQSRVLLALLTLGGASTLGTDLYQHVAVRNRPRGVSYFSRDEVELLAWARQHLPSDAIVQLIDEARPGRKFRTTGSPLVAGIAERRSLFGNYEMPYLFQADPVVVEDRRKILESLFAAREAEQALRLLRALPPHYLLVREVQPGPHMALAVLRSRGEVCEVARTGTVSLSTLCRRSVTTTP